MPPIDVAQAANSDREPMLHALAGIAFLIFFQAYMIAPLVPMMARAFGKSVEGVGLLVPAYVLPYGISTLFYGPLSDRIGRRRVLMTLMVLAVPVIALSTTARTLNQLLLWRVLTGVTMGGIIPMTLAMIGDQYAYRERGRPLGWIFGAIAGGMAFGSTLGAWLEPLTGWRGLFVMVSVLAAVVLIIAWPHRHLIRSAPAERPEGLAGVFHDYVDILGLPRAALTYGYIFANGAFHSGVFTWLGLYFEQRYGLTERGIGFALLGYGIPGLVLGPTIGRLADRYGRRWLIAGGLALAAVIAGLIAIPLPVIVAATLITFLSLGQDMSHPLLAGIVSNLDDRRRGQATGLMAFFLFCGFGLGSIVFGSLLHFGMNTALLTFAAVQVALAVGATRLFRRRVTS